MLKKTFVSSLYVIPATVAVLLFATHVWFPEYLITPPQLSGFADQIEFSTAMICVIFFSFILPNRFEIELGLVNGYGTLKLALTKALPVFVYTVAAALSFVAVYRYTPFDLDGYKTYIPIVVPDDWRVYVFLSVFVTALFFSTVCFFLRILMRNCYLPIIGDLLIISLLMNNSEGIRKGTSDIRTCLFDPFITTYFVGNSLPNDISAEVEGYAILKNAWTYNRLIFLALSAALIAATVFLLRREKLHRGTGE